MESSLLQHLLSSENAFNKRYGASFPLYKFYRLYEENRWGQCLTLHFPPPSPIHLSHAITFGYHAKGNITTITVSPQGQPFTIKDPLNNITPFAYELGDLISIKQPMSRCAAIT